MLKKILISISILILALILFIPYYIGGKIKNYYEEQTGYLTEEYGDNWSWRIDNYRRGWWQSSATTEVLIIDPTVRELLGVPHNHNPEPLVLYLTHHIQHGPILFGNPQYTFGLAGIHTEVIPNEEWHPVIYNLFANTVPLSLDNAIGFSGSARFYAHSPALQDAIVLDKTLINWGGLEATSKFSSEWKHNQAHVSLPLLEFIESDVQFYVSQLTFSGDSKQAESHLWTGTTALNASEVRLIHPLTQDELEIYRLDMKTDSEINQGIYAADLLVNAERIDIYDMTLGPLNYQFHLDNVNAAKLGKLITELNLTETSAIAHETATMDLLSDGGSLSKNVSLSTQYGPVEVKTQVDLAPTDVNSPLYPLTLFTALNVDMQLEMPRQITLTVIDAWVRQQLAIAKANVPNLPEPSPEEVQQFGEQKLIELTKATIIVNKAERDSIHVNFKNGSLLVNGAPLQIPTQ